MNPWSHGLVVVAILYLQEGVATRFGRNVTRKTDGSVHRRRKHTFRNREMALIPPFFLDCVVAVGFRDAAGSIDFGATGFLYARAKSLEPPEEERLYSFYLVTNRHVVSGREEAVLRFNPLPGSPARTYDLNLVSSDGEELWIGHEDPEIDVAVIPVNIALLREDGIQFAYFHSDRHALFQAEATEAGLTEGDAVYILGFPMGDTGGERNYVIVRGGWIARIRDSIAGKAKTFLVDASIFPGNSGGPVVNKPEVVSITGTKALGNANLIGIVSGYLPYQDVAYSRQTERPRVIFEENSGLSVVVPIDRVQEAVDRAVDRFPPQEDDSAEEDI